MVARDEDVIRNEVLEEAARVVWVDGEKPSETWTDSQTGEPAFDPIQVSRMNIAFAIRALKREPNAAGRAEAEPQMDDKTSRPAAPLVERLEERLRNHSGEWPIELINLVAEAATAISLAQTEIKGHMRVKDDLQARIAALEKELETLWGKHGGA